MNFTFNSRGKIWNCSLNLPFLHPHATISSNNSNTTTSVRISLVDSTVRNNLCHPSFDSNVKYESNNITASSSRPYHAGILIFWSTRTVIRKWSPCLPHKGDRWPAAESVFHTTTTTVSMLKEICTFFELAFKWESFRGMERRQPEELGVGGGAYLPGLLHLFVYTM